VGALPQVKAMVASHRLLQGYAGNGGTAVGAALAGVSLHSGMEALGDGGAPWPYGVPIQFLIARFLRVF
jgi:hypothetical protein